MFSLFWSIHNVSKTLVNAVILVRIAASRQIMSVFMWSAAYELVFDPLALSLADRDHSNTASLFAHHMMVFIWAMAMAMAMADGPRTWVIATIAANRVAIYGAAAMRSMRMSSRCIISRRRSVVVRAFLSTLQFVAAAFDGFAVMMTATVTATPLQFAIAASQFGIVTGLGIFHLRLAAKTYGVLLVDTHTAPPTLIPIWVP